MSHRRAKRDRQEHMAEQISPVPHARRGRDPRRRVQAPARRGAVRGSRTKLWIAVGSAAALAAIIAGVVIARGNSGPASAVRVSSGGGAVQLSGTNPINGQPVDIANYTGKPVVLNIWASWCPGCRAEAPDLVRFVKAHPEAQLIGIDIQDNAGDARAFYREFNWTWPSVNDPSGSTSARFGLQGLPTTIFLDKQHRIVTQIIGASDFAGFERGLREATGKA